MPIAVGAKLRHGVCAKHPITFELRLGEELIGRALVRKLRICFEVFVDVTRFVAITSGSNIDDDTIRCSVAVHDRITDATDSAVMAWTFHRVDLAARINAHWSKFDRNSKIDANFAHGLTEIGKGTFRVLGGVAYYNVMAAAQQHLIKPKVLEMAAIGEVHIFIAGCRVPNRFGKHRPHRISRASSAPGIGAGSSRIS